MAKKLFLFILVMIFLFACFIPEMQNVFLSDFFEEGTFSIFTSTTENLDDDWSVTSIGSEFMATCNVLNKHLKINASDIRGQMIVLDKSQENIDSLNEMKEKLKYKEIKCEDLTGVGLSYYGYCEKLNEKITLSGKDINMQIVIREDSIVIGIPVILGSY